MHAQSYKLRWDEADNPIEGNTYKRFFKILICKLSIVMRPEQFNRWNSLTTSSIIAIISTCLCLFMPHIFPQSLLSSSLVPFQMVESENLSFEGNIPPTSQLLTCFIWPLYHKPNMPQRQKSQSEYSGWVPESKGGETAPFAVHWCWKKESSVSSRQFLDKYMKS